MSIFTNIGFISFWVGVIFFIEFNFLEPVTILIWCIFFAPLVSILICFFLPVSVLRQSTLFFLLFNFLNFTAFVLINFDFMNYSIQFYNEFVISSYFNLSYSFGLDILNLVFIYLTFFLVYICCVSVWFNTVRIRQNLIFTLVVQFLVLQVFFVLDIFFFFVFYEFVLFPMFLLIGSWGARAQKLYAAYLFFYYTFLGSVLMLFAIIYIHVIVGSTSYIAMLSHSFSFTEQLCIFFGCFLSFASKLPIYPFHVWLPEAHVEAPTSASVLLAGVLLKMGGYGLIRWCLTFFFEASIFFAPFINTLCLISILYASFSALCQLDIKRVIAYSSIVHMSYSTLGIFSFNDVALSGAIFGMITHGVISAGLFLSVGVLYDRFGTRSILNYGGLIRIMPLFDTVFFIFILSNIAFPGTGGFVSEFLTILGIYKTFPISLVVLLLGVFFTGIFSFWLYTRIFLIDQNFKSVFDIDVGINQANKFRSIIGYSDLTYREFCFFLPLIIVNFIFGIFPSFILFSLNCWSVAFFN